MIFLAAGIEPSKFGDFGDFGDFRDFDELMINEVNPIIGGYASKVLRQRHA